MINPNSPDHAPAGDIFRSTALYVRSLIEASLDPLVTISADGKIMDVNQATEAATGLPRAALIGSDFCDYFTEPSKAREGYLTVFSRGVVKDYPLAIRHVSGQITDVVYNASVYRDEQGNVAGAFAAARDITEKKRTQEQLRATSLYARSLIEASLDPLVTISADGKIMDVNRATELVTGRHREVLIGSDFSIYFTQPDKAREGYQVVFRKGFITDYPLAIHHADGRVTDVLYNASVYLDEQGHVAGVFAAARDITERKRTEEELSRFKHVLDNTLDMILMFDPETLQLTYVNNGVVRSLGYSSHELLNMAVYETKPEYDYDSYRARLAPLLSGDAQSVSFETIHQRKNGSIYPVEVFIQFVRRTSDSKGLFISIMRDITARKRAEDELRHAHDELELRVEERTGELAAANAALQADIAARKRIEEELRSLNETLELRISEEVGKNREKDLLMIQQSRLAAMGEMIGNIAHQWRQPLNALGLVLSNIQDAYEFRELSADYLRQCTQNGERLIQKMSSTINDFRNFFQPDKEMRPFSAREQIEEAIDLVSASFKNNNIDISLEEGDDLLLLGFPNEYSQVLLNLLNNAKEAIMARDILRGIVHIGLSIVGEQGCVVIRDNGGGIPDDLLDKIFEPYFSTKPMGTGIGLYMSKMIVERNMHGHISAGNTGAGAEFTLCTPLAANQQGNNHDPA